MRQIEDSNTPSGKENNENLKRSTILSLLWNAFDKVGFQLIAFLIGLVTLRLLSPRDFGLIGALAIFTALSNIFVESGFSSAMIRRKDNKDNEYVALLIFHLTLALLFYGGLFFSAEYIASYYKMPELKDLSRFLFLSIIFNSISIVHIIILTKQLSFKLLSIASLAGAIVGGVVVIVMILNGYTYWALAWQIVLQCAVKCLVLWASCKWFPSCKPDFRIVKELFKFSCSILATSLTNTFVRYIYNPIIGRAFGEAGMHKKRLYTNPALFHKRHTHTAMEFLRRHIVRLLHISLFRKKNHRLFASSPIERHSPIPFSLIGDGNDRNTDRPTFHKSATETTNPNHRRCCNIYYRLLPVWVCYRKRNGQPS